MVDTRVNHLEINSLDDVLLAVTMGGLDILMIVLATSPLEPEAFHMALELEAHSVRLVACEEREPEQAGAPQAEGTQAAPLQAATPRAAPPQAVAPQAAAGDATAVAQTQAAADTIRVHVGILNDLLNLASELVLGRNQLLRTLENYRKSIPNLSPILQNIDRLTSGLQEKVMQTRMQPVGNVFQKFPRIIRDISKSLSKEIDLELEGESVELDKTIIEALTDPLTHLVRNSADHGLEKPADRERLGKPRMGVVRLSAYHEGGCVNIDISDDGAGLDTEKIKRKAVEKGLLTTQEAGVMSDQEAWMLVFKPGFSTADAITNVSGRGVGMDVVKTNIEKLGGSIEIRSVRGVGTTIRLMLPLTLAIIQSLIVQVQDQVFALPQVNLKEIVKVKQGEGEHQLEMIGQSEVLSLRGRLLPITRLSRILGMPDRPRGKESDPPVLRVLVFKVGSRVFGVAVDAILGSEETLVKPLPGYLKSCGCYSGVTIMGDGKTSMILDMEGVIRLSNMKFREDIESLAALEEADDLSEAQKLLLFQCSGHETFGLDLALVSRIEEIRPGDIQRVGDQEFITHRGGSLRVIRPENYLDVSKSANADAANPAGSGKLYVIIPKLVRHPLGILIRRIEDNIHAKLELNTEEVQSKGIMGTALYNERLLLILNLYELFEEADPKHYTPQVLGSIGKKLLLAEDTPFFQRVVQDYFEKAGFRVSLAANGKEALQLLAKGRYEVVVSDIQMPIMDGLELVQSIRENEAYDNLPVIALSSMSEATQIRQGLDAGFDYYECKLDRDRLLGTVTEAIQKGRQGILR